MTTREQLNIINIHDFIETLDASSCIFNIAFDEATQAVIVAHEDEKNLEGEEFEMHDNLRICLHDHLNAIIKLMLAR